MTLLLLVSWLAVGRLRASDGIAFGKSHSLLHELKKARPKITITLHEGTPGEPETWEMNERDHLDCDLSICTVTRGSSRQPTSDAVWFDGTQAQANSPAEALHCYFPERQQGQIWIIAYEESPCHQFLWQTDRALALFNMSVTPHWHTGKAYTISPFGLASAPPDSLNSLLDKTFFLSFAEKTKAAEKEGLASVMWIASQCGSSQYTGRMEYMRELMKHIKVDAMGKCLHNKDMPDSIKGWDKSATPEFYKFNAKYKFAIAFENCPCNSYITEKFWRPLQLGVIPIYLGAPNAETFSPTNKSYINVNDFDSPVALATFIKKLANDEQDYNSYLQHKLGAGVTNKRLLKLMKKNKDLYNDKRNICKVCDQVARLKAGNKTQVVTQESFGKCYIQESKTTPKEAKERARTNIQRMTKLADEEVNWIWAQRRKSQASHTETIEHKQAAKVQAPASVAEPVSSSSSNSVKGILYYLSTDLSEFGLDLITSMRCMWKHYIKKYKYPIVIFVVKGSNNFWGHKYSADIFTQVLPEAEVTVREIEIDTPRNSTWQKHCFNPQGVDEWAQRKFCGCTCARMCWKQDYLKMNRFFVLQMWKLFKNDPYLKQFDYFMRVDADVFVIKPIVSDPLANMVGKGCHFSTKDKSHSVDSKGCYEGQLEAVIDFVNQAPNTLRLGGDFTINANSSRNIQSLRKGQTYWGGWHAGSLRLLESDAHLALADYMQENGGMWIHRWSDQTHFPLAVAMLSPSNSVCEDSLFNRVSMSWAECKGGTACAAFHMHTGGSFPTRDRRNRAALKAGKELEEEEHEYWNMSRHIWQVCDGDFSFLNITALKVDPVR